MISVDWTLGYQMALFLFLMIFLGKFLFKPILAVIDARAQAHQEPLRRADELGRKLETARKEYEEVIGLARDTGKSLEAELAKELAAQEKEIIRHAQKKAEESLNSARNEMEEAKARLIVELPREAESLAEQLAVRLVGR